MQIDVPDTLIEFADPVPMGSPMFAAGSKWKIRHLKWLLGALLLILAGLAAVAVSLAVVQGRGVLFAVGPFLAIAAVLVLRLLFLWRRMEFCPSCAALTFRPRWKTRLTYCPNCGRLVDPSRVLISPSGTFDLSDERNNNGNEPVVKLLALVFLLGVKDRATEIRFEPGAADYHLSFRCDGVLYEMVPPPRHLHRAISDTLKAFAGLSLETGGKQSGKLQIRVEDHIADASVEVEPAPVGENVVVLLTEAHST